MWFPFWCFVGLHRWRTHHVFDGNESPARLVCTLRTCKRCGMRRS